MVSYDTEWKLIFLHVKIQLYIYHKRQQCIWCMILYDSIVALKDYMLHRAAGETFGKHFMTCRVCKTISLTQMTLAH